MEQAECLEQHRRDCVGPVEYRYPLSASGRWFPRCEKHWQERLEVQRGIDERYPVHAPADFDPSYTGEFWDDDY